MEYYTLNEEMSSRSIAHYLLLYNQAVQTPHSSSLARQAQIECASRISTTALRKKNQTQNGALGSCKDAPNVAMTQISTSTSDLRDITKMERIGALCHQAPHSYDNIPFSIQVHTRTFADSDLLRYSNHVQIPIVTAWLDKPRRVKRLV